jgi:hypothetical protein
MQEWIESAVWMLVPGGLAALACNADFKICRDSRQKKYAEIQDKMQDKCILIRM